MHRNISVIWSSGFAIHTPVFCICPIEEVLRLIWGRLLLLRKPLIYLWLPWKVRQWKCGRKPNKAFSVKKPQACFQWKADLQFFHVSLLYFQVRWKKYGTSFTTRLWQAFCTVHVKSELQLLRRMIVSKIVTHFKVTANFNKKKNQSILTSAIYKLHVEQR